MAIEKQREKTYQMRVTDDEYNIVEKKASMLGLVASNYMRMVCLHATVNITIGLNQIGIENMNGENIIKPGQREKTCQMRVTDEEYKHIEAKANALGLAASNYMRMVCLHANIGISIQPQ